MQLTTPVDIVPQKRLYNFEDTFVLLGSCFSQHIAQKMRQAYINVVENPFGVQYNPMSIAKCMQWLKSDELFTEADLVYYDGLYHSMLHHGEFSSVSKEQTLSNINDTLQKVRQTIRRSKQVNFVVTFGTAYVYLQDDEVVSNCHKMPALQFVRQRLTVGEIVDTWSKIAQENHEANFQFTVSPIRHKKDGLHNNQLSKAILHLAIEQIGVDYFPAYEIMMDELRDYRFYAEDMLHPSDLAVEYIWQQYKKQSFTPQAQQQIEDAEQVWRMQNHVMLHPDTAQAKEFKEKTEQKYKLIKQKYSWIEKS